MFRWPSWAPIPNKPTVSVDVKQHFNRPEEEEPKLLGKANITWHLMTEIS